MDKSKIYKGLEDFVKIQSVSTDRKRFQQILLAVDFLENKLKEMGFSVNILKKEDASPLIIASRFVNKEDAKTIGIYGHYDVQPEDPVDQWQSSPFQLTINNGKLYGRGVADDKGHIIQNLVSIGQLIETNELKNNIVFILEGEEELGSLHFEDYIAKAKEILDKVDVFYLTDTGMHTANIPQIFYGLRGIIGFEINLETGKKDLHSGIYGNRVLNPAQVLADLFVKIKDLKTNKITIPDFYKKVRKIEPSEMNLLEKTVRSIEEEKRNAGVYKIMEFEGMNPSLSSKINPSFEINGIKSGYIDEGFKTIIPNSAMAKFSFRLVEYQDPFEIENLVQKFVQDNLPEGVKYELKTHSKSAPFYTLINNEYVKKTAEILKNHFGHDVIYNRSGGSIPASEILQRVFKKPIILTGFTLPDDNIHAPNENFDEEMFLKGTEALQQIYNAI